MNRLVTASDGLPAHQVGVWNDQKLDYIERYVNIFAVGMKNRWPSLVYADFFSGPGMCVAPGHRERVGTALIAARHAEFTRLFLNDLSPVATAALRQRLPDDTASKTLIAETDCNDAVGIAREFLFQTRSTLGLAVIDPFAYQMRFDSIARLTRDVRCDLLITVMTGFPRRFLSGTDAFRPGSAFDLFIGTREWEGLRGRAPRDVTRGLLDIYRQQLEGLGYKVDDRIAIRNSRDRPIYHLVYASRDARGIDFWQKATDVDSRRQGRMI